MPIFCGINKVRPSIDVGFWVLEHIVVDIELIDQKIYQKYKTNHKGDPFISTLGLFLEVKPFQD